MPDGQAESPSRAPQAARPLPAVEAPFIRAPESARSVFVVMFVAACGPLAAGILLFGWRAAGVAGISVGSCVVIEWLYFRVTRTPALLGRTHACLTGVLLALTLPPFVPWYVPVVAAAFAIIVGKAVFGGVGHFLWQPALVGRLAVAVVFSTPITGNLMNPEDWGLLARERLLFGDIRHVGTVEDYRGWQHHTPADASEHGHRDAGYDGFKLRHPRAVLAKLTRPTASGGREEPLPAFSGLAYPREMPRAAPAGLRAPAPDRLPPLKDLIYGTRPGGIGETAVAVILVAGFYLVYRNFVKWQLPVTFILSAAAVAAVAPVRLSAPNATIEFAWLPVAAEGFDVGLTYVSYQLFSGEILLAAFFLAPEMTSRPVTAGGQALFGVGCGGLAMLLQLYVDVAIPAYMAVLAMNTFTPVIDALWRPRVFGRRRFAFLRRHGAGK